MSRRPLPIAIPEPYEDVASLRASVMALKELVEVLAGQRGGREDQAVTWGELPGTTPGEGTHRIDGGTLTVATQFFYMPMPPGYVAYELHIGGMAVNVAASVYLSFSFDGGVTYPNAANQYIVSYSNYGAGASGSVGYTGTTTPGGYIIPTLGLGSGKRGMARIWMPCGHQYQSFRCDSDYYNGSNYIILNSWGFEQLNGGVPTHARVNAGGSSLLSAGLRWQLNGIK